MHIREETVLNETKHVNETQLMKLLQFCSPTAFY